MLSECKSCYVSDIYILSPGFADDLAALSISRNKMQEMIEKAHEFSRKWRFDLNVEKCKTVIFTARNRAKSTAPNKPLKLEGKEIPIANSLQPSHPFQSRLHMREGT